MTLTRPAFDAAVLAEVCLRPRLLLGWVGRIAFIVPDSRPSVDPPLAAAAACACRFSPLFHFIRRRPSSIVRLPAAARRVARR